MPQVYHFDSEAESAVALEALLHPDLHGLEVQLPRFRSGAGAAGRSVTTISTCAWQKFEEAVRLYGEIAAPSARERCLHLGVKREMSTTSEGVNRFGIPFNSSALQRFADGQATRVTVHIDSDFMKHEHVTAERLAEVIMVDLSMTAFNDLTLEEILDLMTETAKANPKQCELHDAHLKEARARRARESGFFPDSRAPESYSTLEKLQKQADRLRQVAFRPAPVVGPTAARAASWIAPAPLTSIASARPPPHHCRPMPVPPLRIGLCRTPWWPKAEQAAQEAMAGAAC